MLVLTLTHCPPALRGDVTKWLLEIDQGVYVGNVSARVRDLLWERIKEHANCGKAIMVFSSGKSEQKFSFYTHDSAWQPIDYDGIKLMMRPHPEWKKHVPPPASNEKKRKSLKKAIEEKTKEIPIPKKENPHQYDAYVVIDIETTGLSVTEDVIIEVGAIKVQKGVIHSTYQAMIKTDRKLPEVIVSLTGITDKMLHEEGKEAMEVFQQFFSFIGDAPIVVHNQDFEFKFLNEACARNGFPLLKNQCHDTLAIARTTVKKIKNYKLQTLIKHFSIEAKGYHRSLEDCFATMQLFEKLNQIRSASN
jgi:CRISPR-associated protein Cas2